jgi:CTP synthase (UTP-ammonia lyase)
MPWGRLTTPTVMRCPEDAGLFEGSPVKGSPALDRRVRSVEELDADVNALFLTGGADDGADGAGRAAPPADDPSHVTLKAIDDTFDPVKKLLNRDIRFQWYDTDKFDFEKAFGDGYSGLWITPGSPYKDMDNVLNAISFTRNNRIPTFGNCGGFQHMLIEYAKNVCQISKADHQETNPSGNELIIVKLACSLVGQSEILTITRRDSMLNRIIGKGQFKGGYFCSYGLNDTYLKTLESKGLIFTAASEDGQMRAFEMNDHPFYLGTLFQPAMTSNVNNPNPIIVEFVRRCIESDKGREMSKK